MAVCLRLFEAVALDAEEDKGEMLPPGLGKPPPLLPTPPGPAPLQSTSLAGGSLMDHSPPIPAPLLPTPGRDYKQHQGLGPV